MTIWLLKNKEVLEMEDIKVSSSTNKITLDDLADNMKIINESLTTLNNKVKQLYQQTYSPPTNNDLNKSINQLSDRINTVENRLREALKRL
jgi:prefoldin subunit 5